jgi:hypothetical protein
MGANGVAMALLVAACGASDPAPPDATLSPAASPQVNPARIDRSRDALPGGYEVAGIAGPARPTEWWGFGAQWTAAPPQCGVLADPALDPGSTRGWSGSGPGGIVYAVVAESTANLDAAVTAECGQWGLSGGHASGTVSLTAAPTIEGAETVAMATATTTVVEGGTETHSHADTVTAYLRGHVVFVSVVTDPGSPNPRLGAEFANELMVKTVAALRS